MYINNNSKEHILACLSPSPSNEKIILAASQMAKSLKGDFTALYVKAPAGEKLNKENQQRLEKHIRLAEDCGAEIVTVYGDDVPQQITEFARISKITKIVLGHSNAAGRSSFGKQTLTDKLARFAPGIDIYIIPDSESTKKYRLVKSPSGTAFPSVKKIVITLFILILSTAMGFLFNRLSFTEANTITVYILGALLTALFTKNYLCSGAFSFVSVLLFNFLFTEPRLSLEAYESGYPVTFVIMLASSLITGVLANKLASNAKHSANTAYRTGIMLETSRLLQKADSEDKIISIIAQQINKLLSRNIIIYPADKNGLLQGRVFPVNSDNDCRALLTPQEFRVAKAAFESRKRCGATTNNMKYALCLYLPVKTNDEIFCVIGIQIGTKSIDPFENGILISILGECALAIESVRNAKEKERIALLAKNEQLRANLLRSISHDLRTPLTSISGNTENLLSNFDHIDEKTRRQLLKDVYDDSQWLINLVENLLSVTRISEGRMNIKVSAQLIGEVIAEALLHIGRKGENHNITTDFCDDLLLADMDARLICQVVINLVENAVKYTPDGSDIKISTRHEGNTVLVSVADNGPGIDDEKKEDVFKMFYTGENKTSDCRRSLGLGLYLCRSIVNAHGGKITLTDNLPHGCIFTFTLKSSEVHLNE